MNRQEMIEWAEKYGFDVAFFRSGKRSNKNELVLTVELDGVGHTVEQFEADPEKWRKYWERDNRNWFRYESVMARWRAMGMIVVSRTEGGPGYGLCKDL